MLLEVKNIDKYYGNRYHMSKALDNICFQMVQSEFLAIMGASGSGKTTLLNCISTIDNVSAGQILFDHKDITKINGIDVAKFRSNNLGFIFQDYNLLDILTVGENIALPLTISHKVPEAEINKKVAETAEKLGIQELLQKYPYQISGGEKQRCACARALIGDPKLLLADEPTGALDSGSSRTLLTLMNELNDSYGATILMVTHDAFAASFARRVLFLKDGKVFNDIYKGDQLRNEFYQDILNVITIMEGGE